MGYRGSRDCSEEEEGTWRGATWTETEQERALGWAQAETHKRTETWEVNDPATRGIDSRVSEKTSDPKCRNLDTGAGETRQGSETCDQMSTKNSSRAT